MSSFRAVLCNSRKLKLATYYVFGWDQAFYMETSTTFCVRLEDNSRVIWTQNMKSERKRCYQKELCRRKKHTHTHTVPCTFLHLLACFRENRIRTDAPKLICLWYLSTASIICKYLHIMFTYKLFYILQRKFSHEVHNIQKYKQKVKLPQIFKISHLYLYTVNIWWCVNFTLLCVLVSLTMAKTRRNTLDILRVEIIYNAQSNSVITSL